MELYTDAFLNLRHLMIGKMKYDWFTITKCLMAFPAIQQLMASFNVIETLIDVNDNSNIMKLTKLCLEENLISDWDEVLKLGKLPWLVKIIYNLKAYISNYKFAIMFSFHKLLQV
jgi:hypothetical protein